MRKNMRKNMKKNIRKIRGHLRGKYKEKFEEKLTFESFFSIKHLYWKIGGEIDGKSVEKICGDAI